MIKVIKPGLYTSVQDKGRFGSRNLGVPLSGSMDSISANYANSLLNNSLECAVLEITMMGPLLEFLSETQIVISGAELSASINSKSILNNKIYHINEGDVLSFGKIKKGIRSYLAVSGGFQEEKVLNSRSFYKGITSKMKLKNNDMISLNKRLSKENLSVGLLKNKKHFFENDILEVYAGPEFDLFSKGQQNKLVTSDYSVSVTNNRMGYRLNEVILRHSISMITSPVIPGTVQLTPEGKLIVLMRDAQTTGGYPRVLQLTEKSISILSQKTSGASFKFKLVKYKTSN